MNTAKVSRVIAAWLAVALLSSALTACGTLEIGVERTPTPDQAAMATVCALATENARLATQVATLAVSTSTPAPSLGKLAYVQGGDIWVKTLPDGKPLRLTTDGRNSTPRWSPSGRWIAFRKGEYGQVWVMHADGSDARSLQTPPNAAFAWSPVADRLIYADGDRLKVANADGTDPATLVAGPSVTPPTPPPLKENTVGRTAWSADGTWIAYEWYEKEPEGPLTYQGLWKVAANGGKPIELYRSGAPQKGEAILAGWSLDGQRILFWQGDVLSASMLADGVAFYSLPAGGGEPIKLVDTALVHDDFLASAPQGDSLAVTAGSYRATWTNKRVAVIKADGDELTWLTDESAAAFSPTWSPDGVHVGYAAMPDQGDLVGGEDARLGMMKRHIWVAEAEGRPQPQQLTSDPAYRDERPLWSADGNYLLFARMDVQDRASLWLISTGGGDPHRVVDELTPLPGPAPGWWGYYGYVEWDQLFDWWRGPAVQQVQPKAAVAVPTPTPTISPILAGWQTYTSSDFHVTLRYPARWEPRPGYGESFGGEDGLVGLNAVSGGEVPLEEVAQRAAYHHLQPYGSQPTIESLQVQGQPARLILPSADQPQDMRGEAELIILYPQPVTISGERYRYFVLHADQDHIRQIAETLKFEPTIDIQVYFAHTSLANEATCVKPVTRTIAYTLAVGRAAIEELLRGPTLDEQEAGFWSAIPGPDQVAAFRERVGHGGDRVRLNSLRIVDDVAYVDFSGEMEAHGGGSARVMCLRQQIVRTLKQFPTVQEVVISVEGCSEDVLQP